LFYFYDFDEIKLTVQEDTAICLAVSQSDDEFITIGRKYTIACHTPNTITFLPSACILSLNPIPLFMFF